MDIKAFFIGISISLLFLSSCKNKSTPKVSINKNNMSDKIQKTDKEWQALLTPAQFHVLREQGTEAPRSGEYDLHFENGTYCCAGCGTQLFESNNKYDAHCGWPSFDKAIEGTIIYKEDTSLGRVRTEIICAKCDGHLGHVFDDGPQDTTGKRYCVNSLSLKFEKE